MRTNWLYDQRRAWGETVFIDKVRFDIRATPAGKPGDRGYDIVCYQLPGWRGFCDYAGPATPGNRVCDAAIEQGLLDWPRGALWGAEPPTAEGEMP